MPALPGNRYKTFHGFAFHIVVPESLGGDPRSPVPPFVRNEYRNESCRKYDEEKSWRLRGRLIDDT